MDLILWRHAEAEDAAADQDDLERKLTERGEKQARRIAKWLHEHGPKEFRVIASPARRTQQTAAALNLPFDTDAGIGPAASPADLLAAAKWPHGKRAVVLVGHQPTLGQVAARIFTGRDSAWNVKKGALWWISGKDAEFTLLAVVDPRFA